MTNTKRITEGLSLVTQGLDLLSRGPLAYDMKCLLLAKDLLLNKYAPFKIGDRVVLSKTPTINDQVAPGWRHCKHFLVEGAKALVDSVSIDTSGLVFHLIFDDESWIDSKGKQKGKEKHLCISCGRPSIRL